MPESLSNLVFESQSDAAPLVIAHGLFGSARNWGAIAKRLSSERRVVAVDLRNHGNSFWNPDHSYAALADDLAGVIRHFGSKADVLGHSMGGKAAMVLAIENPGLVRKLVVADIAPVTYAHSHATTIAAMQAVDLARVMRRADADAQLALHLADASLRAFLMQSLEISPSGAAWKLNLTALRQNQAAITGFPDVDKKFAGPALFLGGAGSDYLRPDYLPTIHRLFANASFAVIEGAGHWLHAEKPAEFARAVSDFLKS